MPSVSGGIWVMMLNYCLLSLNTRQRVFSTPEESRLPLSLLSQE